LLVGYECTGYALKTIINNTSAGGFADQFMRRGIGM
jgi:hypothetical protein